MIEAKLLVLLAISAAPWHRPTCAPALNHRTTELLHAAGIRCAPRRAPAEHRSVHSAPVAGLQSATPPPGAAAAR